MSDETQNPNGKSKGAGTHRRVARVLVWLFGVPSVLILVLYAVLLITPIPMPMLRDIALARAADVLPDGVSAEFGDVRLALESGLPVVQVAPFALNDRNNGSEIKMEALAVGFSPVRAVVGQPVLSVTLVRPHLQIIQDLFGPRLAGFALVDDEDGNDATIWVMEGEKSLPSVKISAEGLDVLGAVPAEAEVGFRSDNDWLIYNLKATIDGITAFKAQADNGMFSRFRVRDGVMEMHDSVYGLLRQFDGIELDVAPTARGDAIKGNMSANLAGRTINIALRQQVIENGDVVFTSEASNLDFASLLPFIDDPDGLLAVRGVGALGIAVTYSPTTDKVTSGLFDVDLTGAQLRVKDDLFPMKTTGWQIAWTPDTSQFRVADAELVVGKSSGIFSGVFVMGIDKTFGPTISMALEGRDVVVHPNDMMTPGETFDEVAFNGWSAPLYGAIGIDQMVVRRGEMLMRGKGRVDALRAGLAIDMEMGGEGATADDLKRLWPYFLATGAREWFVANVLAGSVESAGMRLNFPLGSISTTDEDRPVPKGALSIDLVGTDVQFRATKTMDPVAVTGQTRISVRDNVTTASLGGAEIATDKGPLSVSDAAFIIDIKRNNAAVYEISGDVRGTIPAVLALAKTEAPDAVNGFDAPIDPTALTGAITGSLVATIIAEDEAGVTSIDYAANGGIKEFASAKPIEGYAVKDGQLSFSVTPEGYTVRGDVNLGGVDAQLDVDGALDGDPNLVVSADLGIAELAEFGFDASAFLSGQVRVAAKPLRNGALQVTADLKQTGITLTDLGVNKAEGAAGALNAEVVLDGDNVDVSAVSVTFGSVDLRGKMKASLSEGLKSAEMSRFRLSKGDDASVSLTPSGNGISVRLRGNQLNLQPMLKRYFALDQVSTGGPQSTQFDEALNLDIELQRAIGFYSTVAYNLDLKMSLVGEDLRNVSMQAQFTEGNSVSVATNRTQSGRTMSVAFNDAGTLLRFLNVYPRLLGGRGSLTLAHNTVAKIDRGDLKLQGFSLVDEAKVVEILGNHKDSRNLIAKENRLNFNNGEVQFIRSSDRIEVLEAVLEGDTTGGTMRGFVYTKEREYDLVGTYVPIFALNSIFQKLPIIGQILGGRDGEGLVGVTFAIRGSLDDPQFLINPASVLLPGAFRSLMEFRAREKTVVQ